MSEDADQPGTHEDPEKKTVLSKLKLGAVVAIVVLTVIVIIQNTESVTTNILFMKFEMPRAALLILTFLLGTTVGVLIAFIRGRKHRE